MPKMMRLRRGDGGSKHCPSPSFPQPVSLISAVGWMASLGGMGSGTVTCESREQGGDVLLVAERNQLRKDAKTAKTRETGRKPGSSPCDNPNPQRTECQTEPDYLQGNSPKHGPPTSF